MERRGRREKKRRRNNAGIIVCVIVMAGHIMTTDNGWGVPVAAAIARALAMTHTANRREKVLKRPRQVMGQEMSIWVRNANMFMK